jgi:hypothetical protein
MDVQVIDTILKVVSALGLKLSGIKQQKKEVP